MSERPTRRPRGAPLHHDPAALTYAREKAGLTKRALAARCGFSEQLMCDIEAGRRSATPTKLRQIAAALNCPPVVLEAKRPGVPDLVPPTAETGEEERQAS
ncbi:helix-turn-helix transcriptional regulator [Streptomyces sp. NPDC005395]|uniref:helix-turn-helix domain-containing protein n=1 Tax=Streptomyces sp. NPDC005395 TaxID=3157042 RepID=UPI0033BECD9E